MSEMEAKDLRLGNRIRRKSTDSICTVNLGIIKDIELGKGNDYEPIPITEDWLVRFGFESKVMHFQKTVSHFYVYKRHTDNQLVYRTNNFTIELKFIHQLQNLYFALTGNELILK